MEDLVIVFDFRVYIVLERKVCEDKVLVCIRDNEKFVLTF